MDCIKVWESKNGLYRLVRYDDTLYEIQHICKGAGWVGNQIWQDVDQWRYDFQGYYYPKYVLKAIQRFAPVEF